MKLYVIIFGLLFIEAVNLKGQERGRLVLNDCTLLMNKFLVNGKEAYSGEIIASAAEGEVYIKNKQLQSAIIVYSLDTLKDNYGNLIKDSSAKRYFHSISDSLKNTAVRVTFSNKGKNMLEVSLNINGTIQKFLTRYLLASLSDRWAILVGPINVPLDSYKTNQQNYNNKM